MFNAQYISATKGISQKSEKEWYKIELIASTVNGNAKILSTFCTEIAYNATLYLKPMQQCKVACGVTDNGYLTISNIKAEDR